jgi:hypothetical protein
MREVVRQAAIQRRDIIARSRETHAQVAVRSIKLEAVLVDILYGFQCCPEKESMVYENHPPRQTLDVISKVARVVTKKEGTGTHGTPMLPQSLQHFKALLDAAMGEDQVITYHQNPFPIASAESNVHKLAPTVRQP